ncbi:MAG: selenoneine biosynthesis selenosugar synthase SenB [Vulcanimicrobiaceae bacterium]
MKRSQSSPRRIGIVCPVKTPHGSGNRVTAYRWKALLEELGHEATVTFGYDGRAFDLLVVLHARKGARAAHDFRARYPGRPLVVALTGTDIYEEIQLHPEVLGTLEVADALIALQNEAPKRLPQRLRKKAAVIFQSARTRQAVRRRRSGAFTIAVVGGLRAVKDPLRAAYAVRTQPPLSRVRVIAAGPALSTSYGDRATHEMTVNPRYRWLGAVPHARARRIIAASDLLVVSSRNEGGANVIGEAIACGVPILSSRIAGSIGILGPTYPGYFDAGDTKALTTLIRRAETDVEYLDDLRSRCRALAPLFYPERERDAWRALLARIDRTQRSAHVRKPANGSLRSGR